MKTYEDEEQYLMEALSVLRMQYEKAAKPYLDRLAAIRQLEPVTMTITSEQAKDLGFLCDEHNGSMPPSPTAPSH